MTRARTLAMFSMAAVLLLFTLTASAFAAPVPLKSVDILIHQEQSGDTLIIAGTLPDSASLPASIELAVPAGMQPQWIGEILGGATSDDPTATNTKTSKKGIDVYAIDLKQSRTAQIEAPVSGAITAVSDARVADFTWVPSQDVPQVNLSVRVPEGTEITTAAPGATLQPGPSGFQYYQLTVKNAKAGVPISLSFGFRPPATAASGAAAVQSPSPQAGGSGALVPVFLTLGFAAIGVVLALSVRKKMSSKNGDVTSPATKAGSPQPAQTQSVARSERASQRETAPESPAASEPRRSRRGPVIVATVIVLGVIIGAVLAVQNGTAPQVAGDVVTRDFGGLSTCTTADLTLTPANGGDLRKDAGKIISSLEQLPGLGLVTVDVPSSKMQVKFCESSATEDQIRSAIASVGYTASGGVTSSDAAPTPPATEAQPVD